MTKKKPVSTPDTYREIFDFFTSAVTGVDCGEKCAPLNGGIPVCCDTGNAIPIMQMSEWKHLRSRSKMWRGFKAPNAAARKTTSDLSSSCKAVECRGAKNCERDNRSLSCRTFPFFPYFTREGDLLGLSFYWYFEDRCWVISNMALVRQGFIDEFLKAYETLFRDDADEHKVFIDYSASMRRVFSRWNRPIPIIGRNHEYYLIDPKGAGIRTVAADELPTFAPFVS